MKEKWLFGSLIRDPWKHQSNMWLSDIFLMGSLGLFHLWLWVKRKHGTDVNTTHLWGYLISSSPSYSSVESLSHVRLYETPWTVAHQASLCITNSCSLLKLMSIRCSAESLLHWDIKWAVRNRIVVWPQDSCRHFLPFLYPYAILSPTGVWSSTPFESGLAWQTRYSGTSFTRIITAPF